jgi:hypothetical protein
MTAKQFIVNKFINSDDNKDRLHAEPICEILRENGYKTNVIETGKIMNRIGIGKYNSKCNHIKTEQTEKLFNFYSFTKSHKSLF